MITTSYQKTTKHGSPIKYVPQKNTLLLHQEKPISATNMSALKPNKLVTASSTWHLKHQQSPKHFIIFIYASCYEMSAPAPYIISMLPWYNPASQSSSHIAISIATKHATKTTTTPLHTIIWSNMPEKMSYSLSNCSHNYARKWLGIYKYLIIWINLSYTNQFVLVVMLLRS